MGEDRRKDEIDKCYYTTLFNSVCSQDKDESGKPVQVCERTEKLLRRCVGRPQEIVESRTEKTVEDASTCSSIYIDKDARAGSGLQRRQWQGTFGPEGENKRDDHPLGTLFEKGELYSGALEELVRAAEDMVQDVFGPFGMAEELPSRQPADPKAERPSSWIWEALRGRDRNEKATQSQSNPQQSHQQKPADYSGLVRNIQEV